MDSGLKVQISSVLIDYLSSLKHELNNLKDSDAEELLKSWVIEDIKKVENILKQL